MFATSLPLPKFAGPWLVAMAVMSAPALAQDEKPCHVQGLEMSAGKWEHSGHVIVPTAPPVLVPNVTTNTGELLGPGRVRFGDMVVTFDATGGRLQFFGQDGAPRTDVFEIAIPLCYKLAGSDIVYWVEEFTQPYNLPAPDGSTTTVLIDTRHEHAVGPDTAMETIQVRQPESGETYVTIASSLARRIKD